MDEQYCSRPAWNIAPQCLALKSSWWANVGSTSTALIASLGMQPTARATAVSNFLFNAAGAIVFFPFLKPYARAVVTFAGDPGLAVAWAHLVFNVTVGLAFLGTLGLIEPRLQRWLSAEAGEKMTHIGGESV